MGVLVVNKLFKDNVWVYLVLIFLSMLTPDKWYSELYKFMFPCFLFGYFMSKKNWTETFRNSLGMVACVGSLLYVLAMFLYYDTDTYVYMSGSCVLKEGAFHWHQLFIDVYRVVVGICGAIAFLSVLFLVFKRFSHQGKIIKGLAWLGTMTMGIYCFQDFFWRLYVEHVTWLLEPVVFNRLLLFLVSILFTCVLTWAVRRVKVLNVLFLGGR
jgi:surface polysaccharide O-acyltransferase-like enzyme